MEDINNMIRLAALQGIRRIVDATGRHAFQRLGMGKLAGLPHNKDLPKQLRRDARDLTNLSAQLIEQEKIDPISVAHQTSIELDAAQVTIDSYHERVKALEKELQTVRAELDQLPTLEKWEELNEAVIALHTQLKTGRKLLAVLDAELSRAKEREVEVDDISQAVGHVESIISGEMTESERSEARAYLDAAQRMFENANDPALVYYGIRIAGFNFKIGRKAKAAELFSFILRFETEDESEFSPDKIRAAVVASYIQTCELEQAVNVARDIKDQRERFGAFMEIAEAFRKRADFSAAKDCLLKDCVEAAEAETDYGFYGRESRLIIVTKKLIEIDERNVAKGILKDIAENLSIQDDKQREVLGRIGILLVNIGEDQEAVDLLSRGSGINDSDEAGKLELVASIFPDVYAAINKANQYVLSGIGEIIDKANINAHERIGMGGLAGLPHLSDVRKDIRKQALNLTLVASRLIEEEKLDPILVAHQGLVELDAAQAQIERLGLQINALEAELQTLKAELNLRPVAEEFVKLKEQYRRLREELDIELSQAKDSFDKGSLDEKYFDSDSGYHAALVKYSRSKIMGTAWADKSIRILRLVYAASPNKYVDGLDIVDRSYEDLMNAGTDPSIIGRIFNLIIPFLIYANCPKTGSFNDDIANSSLKNAVKVELSSNKVFYLKIAAVSPDWFGPTLDGLAQRIIALHKKGVELQRYTSFYSEVILDICKVHGYSPEAVLDTMDHIYRALLTGKGGQYCKRVIGFENGRQYLKRERLENPDELSEEQYQTEIRKLADRWEIELGLIDMEYEDRDPIESIIGEARKIVDEGRVGDALGYLEKMAGEYISRGEPAEAEQLVIEAQGIIEETNDPDLFQWVLKIAALNFNIGREDEAIALFLLIAKYITREEDEAKRDDMLFAAAMTYMDLAKKDIRQMKKAEAVARKIEDIRTKYSAFMEISKAYFKNDYLRDLRVGTAVNCLLINCAAIARSLQSVVQFIEISELLVAWGSKKEAIEVLSELTDVLNADPIEGYGESVRERFERLLPILDE